MRKILPLHLNTEQVLKYSQGCPGYITKDMPMTVQKMSISQQVGEDQRPLYQKKKKNAHIPIYKISHFLSP